MARNPHHVLDSHAQPCDCKGCQRAWEQLARERRIADAVVERVEEKIEAEVERRLAERKS